MKQYYFKLEKSNRKDKRFVGIYYYFDALGTPVIGKTHFGLKDGSTYIDHNDDKKKENYIKRHQVNEDWTKPFSAGTLAVYILWNKKTLDESLKDYKRRFKLK